MRIPTATYRIQFHKDFGFASATQLIDYLHELGISDLYASPIFKARAGSMHGYDVVDHSQVDPALGGEAGFDNMAAALRARGMGLVLDIVPNHMGIGDAANSWWMDVLENGPSSAYASYFDIDWHPVNPHLENKVLLPVLEDQYGNVLEEGKLHVVHEDGAFSLCYYQTKFPLGPRTYHQILTVAMDELTAALAKEDERVLELQSILTAITHLPPRTEVDPEKLEERRREKEIVKRRIATLYQESAEARTAIDRAVERFNGTVGESRSFDLLDGLIDQQPYRLAFWRVAAEEINYRRFFDINDLAAIRTEAPEVFEATHRLIRRLVVEGKATSLRVDHPDGLWDPTSYFRQLQQLPQGDQAKENGGGNLRSHHNSNQPLYIVAEKILCKGESLPEDWAVSGTTGYDFLNQVNGIFVRRASRRAFDKIYSDFIGVKLNYRELVNGRKKMIMLIALSSEINSLSHQLDSISERNRHYRDFTLNSLTFAIREVIACLPVYRSYTSAVSGAVSESDRKYIEAAVSEAQRRNPRTARAVFDFVKDTLLLRNLDQFREADRKPVIDFVMEFQQLTGPVMAKAVEDTSFYIYNRLTSLNEVGGEPDEFGISLESFHRQNSTRQRRWPNSMLALSTHDTKRSEDVRARLNALSEFPVDWRAALTRWRKMNQAHRANVDGEWMPDGNDEYLFYQALVGVWPPHCPSADEMAELGERMTAYMHKAAQEAKVHTSWVNPNERYDRALHDFVRGVLTVDANHEFLGDFAAFHSRIAYAGMLNSLSQTALKLTAPGVPDFYQGTELWDLSLVDPDNRRPVDFTRRREFLAQLKQRELTDRGGLLAEALSQWQDGRIKLYVIYKILNFRRERQELFQAGSYHALYASAKFRENVCAFARRWRDQWVIVAVPRLLGRIISPGCLPLGEAVWENEAIPLPGIAPDTWRNILTGEHLTGGPVKSAQKALTLCSIFNTCPVAVLTADGPASS